MNYKVCGYFFLKFISHIDKNFLLILFNLKHTRNFKYDVIHELMCL